MDTLLENGEGIINSITDTGEAVILSKSAGNRYGSCMLRRFRLQRLAGSLISQDCAQDGARGGVAAL
jgi:hypothetical protein